jgi:hypothetical protein
MYGPERVAKVLEMVAAGESFSAVSRSTGVSRATVRAWTLGAIPGRHRREHTTCPICTDRYERLPVGPYAYLLGLYLGDGSIATYPRDVYRLRIACCDAYPDLMDECEMAMTEILPNRVGRVRGTGCSEVSSCSKHWPCLFPQHGSGPKHRRRIVLSGWQQEIVDRFPAPFLRGLIHSDGCRVLNWVNGTAYPRYHFSNASEDIRALFGRACDQLDIEWRQNNARNLSVARRSSVRALDEFVGPKH